MTDDLKLVERLRYRLHDQGGDSIDHRYSIFDGDEIVLLVNPVGGFPPQHIVDALNDRDRLAKLVAEMREKFVGYEKLDDQISYRTRYGGDPGQEAFDRRDALWNELRALLQRTQEQS